MESARVLGNNIRLLLAGNESNKNAFAEALGYSLSDVEKLCDARLYTTKEDILDIANYFSVKPEELFECRAENEYVGEGFLHCMKPFKKSENKEKILNIFDMYCDLMESLDV